MKIKNQNEEINPDNLIIENPAEYMRILLDQIMVLTTQPTRLEKLDAEVENEETQEPPKLHKSLKI